jgi:hypothetical protein
MAAFPFGGHPTFAQYLDWAVSQGCKVLSGVDTEHSVFVAKITAPSGKTAIEVGILPNERLVPTTIGRLDRRLGLISPWFGAPMDS